MSEQGNASADMWGKLGTSNGNDVGAKVRDLATTQMIPSQLEKAQKPAKDYIRQQYKISQTLMPDRHSSVLSPSPPQSQTHLTLLFEFFDPINIHGEKVPDACWITHALTLPSLFSHL